MVGGKILLQVSSRNSWGTGVNGFRLCCTEVPSNSTTIRAFILSMPLLTTLSAYQWPRALHTSHVASAIDLHGDNIRGTSSWWIEVIEVRAEIVVLLLLLAILEVLWLEVIPEWETGARS